jgi:hypothetical protein
LLSFGYSDKDVTPLAFDEAVRLLEEEHARKESEDLEKDMGGVWPSDFRNRLWETVGVWITQPKVLEYWRQQVRTMCARWEQYHTRKDIACPSRFGGSDPRPLCLPDDLPAIYTGVAQLHDRWSVTQIATQDLTQIPWHVGGRDRSWPIPRLFPGADMVRWGHDAQVVDFNMVCRFIEEIRRDLVAHALLSDNSPVRPEKPSEAPGGTQDTNRFGFTLAAKSTKETASQATIETDGADMGAGKGGHARTITLDEANIEVRRFLKENPSWDWTVRKLAAKVKEKAGGGSTGLIVKCPAWQAYKERKDQLRKEGTIKTVSISTEMESVLGTGEKDEVLRQLIAEQEEDQREDVRRAKLYPSHEKKPKRRES